MSAVTPDSWVLENGTVCFWPPNYKESMLKKPPNPKWPKYPITVRGTFGKSVSVVSFLIPSSTNFYFIFFILILEDYSTARSKLSMEESCDEMPKKRRVRKPRRYKTTDSEPDTQHKKKKQQVNYNHSIINVHAELFYFYFEISHSHHLHLKENLK